MRTSSNYACSLGPNGELTCWSPTRNDEPHSASAQVLTFGNWKALRIAAGTKFRTVEVSSSASACALSGTHVRCWGRASPGSELAPVTVGGLRPPIKIAVGGSQACSLDSSGSVRCWSIVAMEPGATIGSEEVVGLRHPTELGCGLLFCCALEGDGHAMCWDVQRKSSGCQGSNAWASSPECRVGSCPGTCPATFRVRSRAMSTR